MLRDIFKKFLLILVKVYQYAISPFLGNNCRYYPSCSHYMIEAIETHGILKGLYLGTRRLLRCHPWHEGGIDLVPPATCKDGCHTKSHPHNSSN